MQRAKKRSEEEVSEEGEDEEDLGEEVYEGEALDLDFNFDFLNDEEDNPLMDIL